MTWIFYKRQNTLLTTCLKVIRLKNWLLFNTMSFYYAFNFALIQTFHWSNSPGHDKRKICFKGGAFFIIKRVKTHTYVRRHTHSSISMQTYPNTIDVPFACHYHVFLSRIQLQEDIHYRIEHYRQYRQGTSV